MAARAIVSSIRQYSHSNSIKLRRITIIDHQVQIKRMSKRVQKYQRQIQAKPSNQIDLDLDEGISFTNIFGVPKITQAISSSSDSDDNDQPEEYVLPYIDQAKS